MSDYVGANPLLLNIVAVTMNKTSLVLLLIAEDYVCM